jgi:hypothetical protein
MNNIGDYVPDWRERDRLYSTTTEPLEYNIIDKIIDKVDVDAYVYTDPLPTWREYPPKIFTFLDMVFEKRAAITDVISVSISADGLMISERMKGILNQFNLGDHRFYPVNILDTKTNKTHSYYWLHFIFDETRQHYIDFPNSQFVVQELLDGEIVQQFIATFDNEKDYIKFCTDCHEHWANSSDPTPFTEVKIKHLKLKNSTPDIIGFGRVDSDLYCTKRLRLQLEKDKVTGITFKGTKRVSFETGLAY